MVDLLTWNSLLATGAVVGANWVVYKRYCNPLRRNFFVGRARAKLRSTPRLPVAQALKHRLWPGGAGHANFLFIAKNSCTTEAYVDVIDREHYAALRDALRYHKDRGLNEDDGVKEYGVNLRYIDWAGLWVSVEQDNYLRDHLVTYNDLLLTANRIRPKGDTLVNLKLSISKTEELMLLQMSKVQSFHDLLQSLYRHSPLTLELNSQTKEMPNAIIIFKEKNASELRMLFAAGPTQPLIDIERFYYDVQRYMGITMEPKHLELNELSALMRRCDVHSALKFDANDLDFRVISQIRVDNESLVEFSASTKSARKLLEELVKLYFKQDV